MAEAIGIVSGLLAIAQTIGELGHMAVKLKALWDEVDAVPQRVQSLVEEIKVLGHLLSDIDNQLGHRSTSRDIWNANYAVYAAYYCRQLFDAMSSLVMDLRREIDSSSPLKRKFKAAKITLQKNKMESMEQRLRSACGLLQMCLQCYSLALSRASYDINAKTLSLVEENCITFPDEARWIRPQGGKSTRKLAETYQWRPQNHLCPRTKKKLHKSVYIGMVSISTSSDNDFIVVTILPPRWLRRLAWGITISYGLQQLNLRYYNVRSNDSDIISRVKNQDLVGMLHLFRDGCASPFDRDEDGLSLLHHAASTNEPTICQKLLELGLDVCIDEEIDDHFSPRETAFLVSLWNTGEAANDRIAYMQLFQRFSPDPDPEDDYQFFLLGCSSGRMCNLTLLSSFQRLVAPSLYSLPACRRLEIARAYCCTSLPRDHPDPNILKFLVKGDEDLLPIDITKSSWDKFSILHTIAISLGRVCRIVEGVTKNYSEERLARWQRVAVHAIAASKPFVLHGVEKVRHGYSINTGSQTHGEEWVGTPLLSVIKGCSLDCFEGDSVVRAVAQDLWQRVTAFALNIWLKQLTSCAVDLVAYGMKEKEIFSQAIGDMEVSLNFKLNFSWWDGSEQEYATQTVVARLRGFEFGPDQGDWRLTWEIDQKEEATYCEPEEGPLLLPLAIPCVPGAWVD